MVSENEKAGFGGASGTGGAVIVPVGSDEALCKVSKTSFTHELLSL